MAPLDSNRLVPLGLAVWLCLGPQSSLAQSGQPAPPSASRGTVDAAGQDAGTHALAPSAGDAVLSEELPAAHVPQVQVEVKPQDPVTIGQPVHVILRATVPQGDRVTLPEQSFPGFELHETQQDSSQQAGQQTYTFSLSLLGFEAGTFTLDSIQLRVVTADGQVGEETVEPLTLTVQSLLANEPNAKLRPASAPVTVIEDDYTLAYVGLGLLAALLIAGLTLLLQRYLRRRQVAEAPPPPPRPPWEVAVEQLSALRVRKQAMLDRGQAVEFVDAVSDVVRAYLGARFGFAGLDTTTAELLDYLRLGRVASGLQEETRAYLRRCDLVKFAKMEPDKDEVDLIFAKAQDIVQFSMPQGQGLANADSVPYPAPAPEGRS